MSPTQVPVSERPIRRVSAETRSLRSIAQQTPDQHITSRLKDTKANIHNHKQQGSPAETQVPQVPDPDSFSKDPRNSSDLFCEREVRWSSVSGSELKGHLGVEGEPAIISD